MPAIQFLSEPEIKALMIKHGAIAKIKAGELRRDEVDRDPAKSSPGGNSIAYSYFDTDGSYICTAHKIITATGKTVHCDVKKNLQLHRHCREGSR